MNSLSDDDLLRRLSEILRQSRRVEADLVALIGEVDARKLYAREAAPSMFAYCTGRLHLSEPEAVLRIRAARASRQHPTLLAMLRDGRLHLSGIALLAPLLTPRNRDTLLRRAAHKSKREIQELVAELTPRPDAPSAMRKLPTRPGTPTCSPGIHGTEGATSAVGDPLCPDTVDSGKCLTDSAMAGTRDTPPDTRGLTTPLASCPDTGIDVGSAPCTGPVGLWQPVSVPRPPLCPDRVATAPAPPARSARVEPLAPDRYKVQFTASAALRDKLQRLQALMPSSVPDGDLGTIIEAAVTEKLERLEARRFARTKTPRKSLSETDTTLSSRHVPAAVRRAVYDRDSGRCTYFDPRGTRCPARETLEFHHHQRPYGRGGDHSAGNVRLMCRVHNKLLAEREYGKEVMARYRSRMSRVSEPGSPVACGAARSRASPSP